MSLAQHLLDQLNWHFVLEQICSEGAPETVKSAIPGMNSCALHVFGDNCTSGSTFQSTDSADVTEENLR